MSQSIEYKFIDKKKLKPHYDRIIKNPEVGKNIRALTKMYLDGNIEKLKSTYLNGKNNGLTYFNLRNGMLIRYLNIIKNKPSFLTEKIRDILYLLCFDPDTLK